MQYRFERLPAFLLLFCFLAVCGCAQPAASGTAEAPRNSRWSEPMQVEGLPNLFRVTPDLYRSGQPDETGMRNAEKMGIKTVLSLRRSNHDPALGQGTGLHLRRVPLTTWNISDDEMVTALRFINNSPKPVLVHCLHGADRTGLTIAMYRMVFQGWSKQEAKDELLNGGHGFHSIWTNIPKMIDEADIDAIRAKAAGPGVAPPF